jgi:dihydrofolate reductase
MRAREPVAYITGPGDDVDNPLGAGGQRLHEWIYGLASWRELHGLQGGESNEDADIIEEAFGDNRAVVMGRRMFEVGERHWGDEPPFHAPIFVVTHDARAPITRQGGTSYTFITDGIESAGEQARAAAGRTGSRASASGALGVSRRRRHRS